MWLFVVARIIANPLSNVFQKVLTGRAADPLFVICATHGLLSLVCLPAVLFYRPPARAGFWVDMTVCALLAVAGNVLIVRAGIALIVTGSYALTDRPVHGNSGGSHGGFARLLRDRGVQYRLAALVLSAVEAVFLKRAVLASSPPTAFVLWAVLGFIISLAAAAVVLTGPRLRHELAVLRSNRPPYLLLGLTTGVMQFCTLATFTGLQVGYALALFQTSTLLTVILGHKVFNEGQFLRRMAGAAVMVAGAILIVASR
jgi:drug/metabolite transporter (DMT)-like permease